MSSSFVAVFRLRLWGDSRFFVNSSFSWKEVLWIWGPIKTFESLIELISFVASEKIFFIRPLQPIWMAVMVSFWLMKTGRQSAVWMNKGVLLSLLKCPSALVFFELAFITRLPCIWWRKWAWFGKLVSLKLSFPKKMILFWWRWNSPF